MTMSAPDLSDMSVRLVSEVRYAGTTGPLAA
jgi:hypothetical protein